MDTLAFMNAIKKCAAPVGMTSRATGTLLKIVFGPTTQTISQAPANRLFADLATVNAQTRRCATPYLAVDGVLRDVVVPFLV